MESPSSTSNSLPNTIAPDGATDRLLTTPGSSPLPAHLARLADRARSYVEAANSANTRRLCLRLEAFCRLVPAAKPRGTSA